LTENQMYYVLVGDRDRKLLWSVTAVM